MTYMISSDDDMYDDYRNYHGPSASSKRPQSAAISRGSHHPINTSSRRSVSPQAHSLRQLKAMRTTGGDYSLGGGGGVKSKGLMAEEMRQSNRAGCNKQYFAERTPNQVNEASNMDHRRSTKSATRKQSARKGSLSGVGSGEGPLALRSKINRSNATGSKKASKSGGKKQKRPSLAPNHAGQHRPGSALGRLGSRPDPACFGGAPSRSFSSMGPYDPMSLEGEDRSRDFIEREAPALSSQVSGYCHRPGERPCTAPPVRHPPVEEEEEEEEEEERSYPEEVVSLMREEEEASLGIIMDEDDEEVEDLEDLFRNGFRSSSLQIQEQPTPTSPTPTSPTQTNSKTKRPPLPSGALGNQGISAKRGGASASPPRELLNCDVGPVNGLIGGEPSSGEALTATTGGTHQGGERNVYRPRPRSAPMKRPDSASSDAGGRRERPLSAPKWGERPPSGRSDNERRAPISTESLRALAGLTDDLLGIVNDEGDEHNPDDLDLVESPRLQGLEEAENEWKDYQSTGGAKADSARRRAETAEMDALLDEDDCSSDEDGDYNMRSAMSRVTDGTAPRDSGRLRLGVRDPYEVTGAMRGDSSYPRHMLRGGAHEASDQIEEELFNTLQKASAAPPAPKAPAPMERFTGLSAQSRPKSAVVQRPRSGVSRKASGRKAEQPGGKTASRKGVENRGGNYSTDVERPMSGKVRGGSSGGGVRRQHRDLVAEALAKDPKKLSRQGGARVDYRPTSANSELYLGTLRAES